MSRFTCPSAELNLKGLLQRARAILWYCLAAAMVLHLLLTRISMLSSEQKSTKPLTTQFIKRQPRLTKPLELKKRPKPKSRRIQRQMVAVRARADRQQISSRFQPVGVLDQFVKPLARLDRFASFASTDLEPEAVAQSIAGLKETKDAIDMSLEMLDIESLDTGRYHAMVIQDPIEKRNIRGFFRLKYAYSQSMRERDYHSFESRILQNLTSLIEAMNRYTYIKTTFEGRISFDSWELLETPWIFIQIGPYPFEMNRTDTENLGRYSTSGGFVFCEAHDKVAGGALRDPACLHNAIHMLQSAIEGQGLKLGRDWTFDRVPDDHPVYHCFYDFDGLPGCQFDPQFVQSGYLRGAVIDNRLVAVLSNKGIMHLWGDPSNPQLKSERFLQLGINTIIFALTQEGSITKRVMDAIR